MDHHQRRELRQLLSALIAEREDSALLYIPHGEMGMRRMIRALLDMRAPRENDPLAEMIAAQGGDPKVTEDVSRLPKAKAKIELKVDAAGYLASICTADVGNAAKLLGAGREKKTDAIDLSVGIVMKKRIGDRVRVGDALATLHVGEKSDRIGAYNLMKKSIRISDVKVDPKPLILGVVE